MNRNFIFASLAFAIAVNIAIIGCHRKGDNESTAAPIAAQSDTQQNVPSSAHNSNVEIKTFSNDAAYGGFGYDVYVEGTLAVHQPNIPAVSGNKGFATKEKAQIAGEFVAYKVKHNIMPPSVTPAELDSLGVLK